MRIIHLTALTRFGGVETASLDVFNEFERQGHEVVVVFDGQPLPGLEVPGRTVVRLPGLARAQNDGGDHMGRVAELIDRLRPDIALTHCTLSRQVADTLCARLPSIAFAHNYVGICPSASFFYRRTDSICHLPDTPNWRCLANAYLQGCNTRRPVGLLASYRKAIAARAYLERFDAIVCDSEYVRERYFEQGFLSENLVILPCPVDIPSMSNSNAGVDRDQSLILFVGRVTPQKGLHLLLSAASKLTRPFRLVVAGDGYDLPRCRKLARKLGLEDRVTFAGYLDRHDVQRLYRTATVLVVPSAWPEPLGMVGPEAMAFGLPVVAFEVGGITEWLLDGRTGLLAKPNDTEDLREKIDSLLGDPAQRARLGENGRRLARDRFALASHVEGLIHLFERVLSRGNHRTPFRVAT